MLPEGPSLTVVEGKRASRPDGVVLVLFGALAAALEVRSFGGLVVAYLGGWALTEALLRSPWASELRRVHAGWLLLLFLVSMVSVFARGEALGAYEGLAHVRVRLEDRARLSASLALDPPLLRGDRLQSLLLSAPSAEHVELTIAGREHRGVALGAGVFRIDVDPEGLALVDGPVHATLRVDGEEHDRVLRAIVPDAHPRALSLSRDGLRACAVSEETDELFVVDADGVTRTEVGDRPFACAFDQDGVWVARRRGLEHLGGVEREHPVTESPVRGQLTALLATELATFVAARVPPSTSEGVASEVRSIEGDAVAPLQGVADLLASVSLLDGTTGVVIALRSPARLVLLDATSLEVRAERPLIAPVIAMAARGARLVIATTDFSEDARPHLGNHFIDDQLVILDGATLAPLGILHTAGRSPAQDHAGDYDLGAGPRGLSFDGEGALIVAFEGSREVVRYADVVALGRGTVLPERHDVGSEDVEPHAPESAVRLTDGTFVVASPASGALVRLSGDTFRVESMAPASRDLLELDPERLRVRMGELAFGEATRSGVSCASCHLFGGSDGVPHNIGGRILSPTLDVRGIFGTAPYLRDGSYPRLSDLHEVAVEEYRGYRLPAGDRGATIEGFLASTVRAEIHTEVDPELARRGAELFVRAECVGCHVPPAFTDLGLHAGSALFPDHRFPTNVAALDTPSLRGVSESPPYLYDGRAETLREVLTAENREGRHGHTSALSDEELEALIAFLEALP